MIEEINEKNKIIEKLKLEVEQHVKTFDNMMTKIKNKIYRNNDYELRNLKFVKDKINTSEYNYREIEKDFNAFGITDTEEIYNLILDMYAKRQKEDEEDEEDEE